MKNNIAEKIFLILYSLSVLIIGSKILFTNEYSGDLEGLKTNLSSFEIIVFMVITIFSYVFMYYFYIFTKNKKFIFKNIKINFNIGRFDIVFFILILINLYFLTITGVGRIQSESTSSLSWIFNIIDSTYLFPIYYFMARKTKNKKLFLLNIVLFILYKISQGWSYIFLILIFYEMFIYFNSKNTKISLSKILLILFGLILIGSFFYQYIFSIKMSVRGYNIEKLTYLESIDKLVNRLTNIHMSLGAYEKFDMVSYYFNKSDYEIKEIQSLFRPIVPSFIMEDKNFRTLNNNAQQAYFDNLPATTSADIGIVMYLIILLLNDLIQFILYIFLSLILLIFTKAMLDLLEQKKGDLNFVYFIVLFNMVYSCSLEVVFSYGVLRTLYFCPILYVFRVLKFNKRIEFESVYNSTKH